MENSSNSIQDSKPNNVKTVPPLKGDLESDSEPSSKDAHHPLLPQPTLSNHVVVNQQQLQDDEDDDWLMSDDDVQGDPSLTSADQHQLKNLSIAHNHEAASSFQKVKSMADRDWERVEAQFKDVSESVVSRAFVGEWREREVAANPKSEMLPRKKKRFSCMLFCFHCKKT